MSVQNFESDSVRSIKPINVDTVHKICSGQVVLSLAVAVKELVENSLDAGATNIEVKLKDYGKELIEVSDNGFGVTEANFAALTLKYHTSKINDYSDLLGVSSYGFRGEALSSLCALANLSVTTRHKDSDYATKIIFDHKGNIVSKTPCSRQVGTTVSLSNLFSSLPVRQKELHKNFKREFTKMTSLLYAYCLISTGVKITCSNQTNSKTLVVATQGSTSFKDNIACVFGIKQLQTLLEITTEYVASIKDNILKGLSGEIKASEESVHIDDIEIDLSEDSNDAENGEVIKSQEISGSQKSQGYKNVPTPVKLTGFISSCAHGSGRSSTDRQYFFINCRPCEPTKVIKLINEVYRQYNPNQYPFVFLNIDVERISVDVNVTPDKRQVFLTKEKAILNVIKASLHKMFENIPKTIKLESNDQITSALKPELIQPRIFNSFITQFSRNNSEASRSSNENSDLKRKSTTLIDFGIVKKSHVNKKQQAEDEECISDEGKNHEISTKIDEDSENSISVSIMDDADIKMNKNDSKNIDNITDFMYLGDSGELPNTQIRIISDIVEQSHQIYCKTKNLPGRPAKHKDKKVITDKEELGKFKRKSITLKTSLEHVTALFEAQIKTKCDRKRPDQIKFKSAINPVFNKKCEEELSREISKESFKEMTIVGQFNLGFIITLLQDDLFIIDQHATDEIYNFETLQKTTELTSQKLVVPQKLELTGVNEQVLMDNLDVFKKNGFTFEIDKDALPTQRVKLLTIPMSKNWVFGKDDIEELLFMLRENYYEHCRPSRVRAMFASRACRKSVMIGTALSMADMRKLVDHMSEIDKPWNCPHGRPTIRHLVNIAMLCTNDDKDE